MTDLHWMLSLCSPPSRPALARPFRLELRSRRLAIATNGWSLVAVDLLGKKGPFAPPPPGLPPSIPEVVEELLGRGRAGEDTSLSRLRGWLAYQVTIEDLEPCESCKGRGSFACDCGSGMTSCTVCYGTGKAGAERWLGVRPGALGGALVNQNLLLAALRHLPGERVRVAVTSGDPSPLALAGPGWWVVLLPLGRGYSKVSPPPVYVVDDAEAARLAVPPPIELGSSA